MRRSTPLSRVHSTTFAALLMAITLIALPAAGQGEPTADPGDGDYTLNVAILIYDGVEVLDFAGPAEVFAVAGGFARSGGQPAMNVYTVARTREAVVSQGFLDVVPDHSIADAPPADVLVLPGGRTGALLSDDAFLDWLRPATERARVSLTVCTGAFLLAEIGRLDGREVTTWYNAVPRLAQRYPEARVQPGRRFVDSGAVVTTAGVSAGIDGALHVVARLLGRPTADRTAQYMEYRWAPEAYLADAYPAENPRLDARGRAVARADDAFQRGAWDDATALYRRVIADDGEGDGYLWYRLGYALHAAQRLDEAVEAHRQAARFDDFRSRGLYNLACAEALRGNPEAAMDALEGAVEAGFDNRAQLLRDGDLAALRDSPRFAALVDRLE